MARYNVYIPYAGVACMEVEANTKEEAIEKAKQGDYLVSDIIPDEVEQFWADAWSETD